MIRFLRTDRFFCSFVLWITGALLTLFTISHLHGNADRKDWEVADHGGLVPVSEIRGSLVTVVDGKPLLVSVVTDRIAGSGSRGSILVMDLSSGESDQYFPKELSLGAPFCLLSTERGTFCYMSSNTFYEFDLRERKFVFDTREISGLAMSMAESKDGLIYVATYPDSWLFEYNPKNGKVRRLLQLDPAEKYPTSMAFDDKGWLYVGLGTSKSNLVAYSLETGELKSLAKPEERENNNGKVMLLADGTVIGRVNSKLPWKRLHSGELGEVIQVQGAFALGTRNSVYWNLDEWHRRTLPGFQNLRVTAYDVAQRVVKVSGVHDQEQQYKFDYESYGASISSIGDAGDGVIMGSTDHPNQLWSYDTRNHTVQVFGGIPELGGGNLTRLVRYKDYLISNSYSRGVVYAIDVTRPVVPGATGNGPESNPRRLATTSPVIGRPRSLVVHKDGRHLISTGFPGYGRVGGGMLIYDLEESKQVALIESENLLPGYTVTSIAVRENGNLILGTSVLTPGGGTPMHKEAVVAEFDWKEKKIVNRYEDFVKDEHVIALTLVEDRYLHVATSNKGYLLYDINSGKVIRRQALSQWGGASGSRGDTSFVQSKDGRLFLVGRQALLEVEPQKGILKERARFPFSVYDSGPIVDGVLYLAAASHLLSVKIPDHQ